MSGIDYKDTFYPTANMTSVCSLMQFAAQHDFDSHQMDVSVSTCLMIYMIERCSWSNMKDLKVSQTQVIKASLQIEQAIVWSDTVRTKLEQNVA